MARTITNQIIDNYYDELSKVRIELTNRIKDIVKEDIVIYDTYSIVKITKDLDVVGNSWEEDDEYMQDITELSLDSLYDLYIELTKGN